VLVSGEESHENGIRVTAEDVIISRVMLDVCEAAWRMEDVILSAGVMMSFSKSSVL